MAEAMNYKSGDLPDFKYASESLMPRVIGCIFSCLLDGFICVQRVIVMIALYFLL